MPEVFQIMTANDAKTLKMDDRIGLIAPGDEADLLDIEGDPEANPSDIRNVRIVFKDGIGYDPAKLIADVQGRVGDE